MRSQNLDFGSLLRRAARNGNIGDISSVYVPIKAEDFDEAKVRSLISAKL